MSAPDAAPAHRLRRFAFRGLVTQGFCIAIALLLWQLSRRDLGWTLAYSLAIGNISWLTIDGGLHLLAHWLGRRLPDGQQRRGSGWPGVPAMLAMVALGTLAGYSLGTTVVDALSGYQSPSLLSFRGTGVISVLAAVTITYFFFTRERLQVEQANAETARRAALENQLRLLESQLEPHMLFNTLANLRVLIALDPPAAQAMLDRLIAYLRATLAASRQGPDSPPHTLDAEFRRLGDYLALMAVRMGPRLAVRLDLPAELRQQPVPPLLLQPLVENAILHGLEPRVQGGRIEVSAQRDGPQLRLCVRDTGVGLPPPGTAGTTAAEGALPGEAASHYGTRHVHERLAALYGTRARFTLAPAADAEGGVLATITLPLTA